MKCLWRGSLLLFLPAANKEINKGLYSGTSSFALGADSLSPNCVVCGVRLSDCWRAQSIFPARPLSLTDAESSHWRSCGHRPHNSPPKTTRKSGDSSTSACWLAQPIRCSWTNWASLIDQSAAGRGGASTHFLVLIFLDPRSLRQFNLLTSGGKLNLQTIFTSKLRYLH